MARKTQSINGGISEDCSNRWICVRANDILYNWINVVASHYLQYDSFFEALVVKMSGREDDWAMFDMGNTIEDLREELAQKDAEIERLKSYFVVPVENGDNSTAVNWLHFYESNSKLRSLVERAKPWVEFQRKNHWIVAQVEQWLKDAGEVLK